MPPEASGDASPTVWESVSPVHRQRETDCHDQFANWSRNDTRILQRALLLKTK